MRRTRSTVDDGRLKVSMQYRTKYGMVFEFIDGANVLAVQISPPLSDDSREWHVETRLGTAAGPALVDAWGATAAEALRKAASTWVAHVPPLTAFDWEGVASALHAVRAV